MARCHAALYLDAALMTAKLQYATLAPLAAEAFHAEGDEVVWSRTWLAPGQQEEAVETVHKAPAAQATQQVTVQQLSST